jgi:hypothetical protein
LPPLPLTKQVPHDWKMKSEKAGERGLDTQVTLNRYLCSLNQPRSRTWHSLTTPGPFTPTDVIRHIFTKQPGVARPRIPAKLSIDAHTARLHRPYRRSHPRVTERGRNPHQTVQSHKCVTDAHMHTASSGTFRRSLLPKAGNQVCLLFLGPLLCRQAP